MHVPCVKDREENDFQELALSFHGSRFTKSDLVANVFTHPSLRQHSFERND